ncbi:MAG: hypothetical protein HQL20_10040 [Candidatus Omnitrophica bacterium]|nr:hypothetical protein [Candidatus Omnitrophota bacterium]
MKRFVFYDYVVAALLFIAAWFFLYSAVDVSQSPNKKIFDLSVSEQAWVSVNEVVFSESRFSGMLILLSRDRFKDVRLDFLLVNPTIAGVAFNFQNQGEYSFFLINRVQKILVFGVVQQGQTFVRASFPMPDMAGEQVLLPLVLQVGNGEAALMLNNFVVGRAPSDNSVGGKVALLVQDNAVRSNLFLRCALDGTLSSGGKLTIKDRVYSSVITKFLHAPGLVYILGLYIVLVFLAYRLKRLFSDVKAESRLASAGSFYNIAYRAAALVTGAVVFVRIWQLYYNFGPTNAVMVEGLLMTAAVFIVLLMIAYGYSRLFALTSTAFLFICLPFLLYALALVNDLTLKISDTVFLRLCLAAMLVPLAFYFRPLLSFMRKDGRKLCSFSINHGLMLLWLVYIVFFFLKYNLDPGRAPIADESTLWVTAAQNMLAVGSRTAQLLSYPAGGFHSFGVSFSAALTGMLWGGGNSATIYFFPLFTIIALLIFLNRLCPWCWGFLFFYLALFNSFDYNGWISKLLYQLVYGEGVTTVYFLIICRELVELIKNNRRLSLADFLAMALGLGLLALTKSPAGYFGGIFMIILAGVYWFGRGGRERVGVLWAGLLFLLPVLLWKAFAFTNGIYVDRITASVTAQVYAWDWNIVARMFICMLDKGHMADAVYYAGISGLLILLTFRRNDFIVPGAICVYIVSIVLYYALSFCADFESAPRYFMPAILATFYFGAIAFERWMGSIITGTHCIFGNWGTDKYYVSRLFLRTAFVLSCLVMLGSVFLM